MQLPVLLQASHLAAKSSTSNGEGDVSNDVEKTELSTNNGADTETAGIGISP